MYVYMFFMVIIEVKKGKHHFSHTKPNSNTFAELSEVVQCGSSAFLALSFGSVSVNEL